MARSAGLYAELCFGVVSNFTRSPAMFFTLFARATVAGSVTPQPYVLVKESLNEFDQSSGRVVSGLLSHNGNDFHEKHVSVDSDQSRGIFLFCLSSRMQNRMRSLGAVLPSRASHYGDVGHLSHVP